MKNQLSVFYEHIVDAQSQTGLPLETVCEKVKGFGFDFVEIDAKRLFAESETILPMLERAGLGVNCIYYFFDFGAAGGSPVISASSSSAAIVPELLKAGATLVSGGKVFSQMTMVSSTPMTARSCGTLTPASGQSERKTSAAWSFAAKTPQGFGRPRAHSRRRRRYPAETFSLRRLGKTATGRALADAACRKASSRSSDQSYSSAGGR